jgi:hypothetical protein
MTEELLADSFMKRLFARFYDMLHAAGGRVPPQLQVCSLLALRGSATVVGSCISNASCGAQAEATGLQAVLEGELGWSFDVEELNGESDDEDAPVVVQL